MKLAFFFFHCKCKAVKNIYSFNTIAMIHAKVLAGFYLFIYLLACLFI